MLYARNDSSAAPDLDIFSASAPARRVALVADAAEQTRRILTSLGVAPVPLVASGEGELARTRHAEVAIIDLDFGGKRQGLRLLDVVHRRTDASIILIGDDLAAMPAAASSGRCQVLHRPVHEDQFRVTVQVALAQRRQRTERRPPVDDRHHQLEQAIRQIGGVLKGLTSHAETAEPDGLPLDALRPRERQIIEMLLEHNRVPAIARALGISAHTVRNHLKNIYRRLGVHSQQDLLSALMTAKSNGLVPHREAAIER
ncbi:MAG: LuxR C-terminal-related transcriptional regulator [Vicinamibacterales bacterium]